MVTLYDKDVPKDDHNTAIMSSLKNQIYITFPANYIFFLYYPISYNNVLYSTLSIPFLAGCSDVYFYITHRPLHSKLLYKYHKHHHAGEICVAKSLDADAIEHLVGNLGSFISGVMVLWYFGFIMNIYILTTWVGIVTANTCISHSNYKCLMDTGVHYNHHKYRQCNYGFGFYIMDRIMGTYKCE
jgi:sterol desaturase/sphingolipid hydroxylase (fatty acid hydroxylase superfamily)